MTKAIAPVQKNEYYDVAFEDLTHDGSGVAKIEGYPIFVPNALPNEKGQIKVTKINKGYAFGRLVELHEESSQRTNAPCPIYKQCGGCQLQHLSYQGQLDFKQKQVKEVLTSPSRRTRRRTSSRLLPAALPRNHRHGAMPHPAKRKR
jgi:23S rRNA (uracil1939-C5)-methyltransferase